MGNKKTTLQQLAAEKEKTLTGYVSTRLPADIELSFKNHCWGLGITVADALRAFIEAELKQAGSSPVPLGSPAFNMPAAAPVADSIPVQQRAENTKKPANKVHGVLNPFKVNGKLPCPICGAWDSEGNLSRHIKKHDCGYTTPRALLTAPEYTEKAAQMVAEKKKEMGLTNE